MGRGGGSSGGSSGGHGRSHYGGRGGGSSSRSSSRSYSSSRRPSSYRSYNTTYIGSSRPYGSFASTGQSGPMQKYKTMLWLWNAIVVTALLALGGFLFNGVTPSTTVRTKLQPQQCIESDKWYVDNDGTWIYDSNKLIRGMREFYNITGIQPYLVIDTGDINGSDTPSAAEYEKYLLDIYDKLFDDGGHLILGFNEPYENSYGMYYVIGDEAKAMFDDEAGEILFDYLDHYYTSDMSDEEFFATVFEKTAKRIMKKSFTMVQGLTVIISIVVLGNIVILTLYGMAVYKKKKEDADVAAAKVLNADLGSVTDDSLKREFLNKQ